MANNFATTGYQPGQVVSDFRLYDTAGVAQQLTTILAQNKPLLLITVSLTCPLSRHSMTYVLPDIYIAYHNSVNFLLVYVVEPHPDTPDVSPYSGSVWITQSNLQDSVLLRQPRRYGTRRHFARQFLIRMHPPASIPLVIDDTANSYWNTFGPAPNNAYLITPQGMVYRKYGWFNGNKDSIMNDIPRLLATVGIDEYAQADAVSVFPNPSLSGFHVSVPSENSFEYTVFDGEGRVIEKRNVDGNVVEFEEDHFAAGIYTIIITGQSGKMYRQRIITGIR
ncbi:MAG TPA: T9SS type A sorting domain-containing protein [Bacteroidia bacterium]|nr:T9SS type A sorting domain-containing protein [Bacteroidia bacterium]